jgi:hypothetical protein
MPIFGGHGFLRVGLALAVWLGAAFPPAAGAATTTIQAAFDGTQPEMPMRLDRFGPPSTCAMEPFPGTFDQEAFWQRFRFCNSAATELCFTAIFDQGNCGDDVHLMAYVNNFDPNNLAMNYAGDTGVSDSLPFSFVVPAGGQFFIVAQTNFGFADCAFSFTVDAMRCGAPAPLLSGAALALAVCTLLGIAFVAMRHSRHALPVLMLLAGLVAFAGPAAAPLAADPTPAPPRACALACSRAYQICARDRCNSSASDEDKECLIEECQGTYRDCLADCS